MFYFSALNIQALMNRFNFELIDFSHAPVHGGSGIFICGKKGSHVPSESVTEALNREKIAFDKRCTHLEAVSIYCEKIGIEPVTTAKLLTKSLKEKIEANARDLNYLPKAAKLPM